MLNLSKKNVLIILIDSLKNEFINAEEILLILKCLEIMFLMG